MLPKSKEIRVEIINQCQYNCVICKKNELTRRQFTMKLSYFNLLIDKILKETKQYDTVSFAGIGEPTLNGDLVNMVKSCTKRGLKSLVVTNGEFVDGAYFKRLQDAGLYSLRVSFHGATRTGYRKLHGVDNFNKVKDNINKISSIKKDTKLLLACVMVYGINKEPVQRWLNLWKDIDADLLEVWHAHDWVSEFKYRKEQEYKSRTCGRLNNGPLQIQADGSVNACCFDWDGKLEFGHLDQQSLKEIFESEIFNEIKKHHDSGNFKGSELICEHCDQRNADKTDVLLYSSKYDKEKRVKMTSTAYEEMS